MLRYSDKPTENYPLALFLRLLAHYFWFTLTAFIVQLFSSRQLLH